jgi:hypothetical protein
MSTKVALVINLKTAKALGLTVPSKAEVGTDKKKRGAQDTELERLSRFCFLKPRSCPSEFIDE